MQEIITGVQAITVDGKIYTNVTGDVTLTAVDNVEELSDGTEGSAGRTLVIAVKFLGSYASIAPIISKPEVTTLTINRVKDVTFHHKFEVLDMPMKNGYILTFKTELL